jgi:HlyD family secretion protein
MKFIIYSSQFVVFLFLLVSCKKDNNFTSPTYKSLTEAVYASGNVYPKNEYKLIANADGYLMRQAANEGDLVGQNQLLFTLESVSQDARIEAAGNIYRQSQSNYGDNSPALREVEMQLKGIKNKLDNDSVNYFRYKELYDQKATTRLEYERAELAFRNSKDDYLARRNSWLRLKNQLYVDLQNSQSNYKVTAKEGENFRVKTFGAGKIYEIYKKVGELVRRGEAIALIGDANTSYLQLSIDETDFAKVKISQDVLVKTDIYGDKTFKAQITKIYPKLNRADQTFRVDAEFIGDIPQTYYGLTIEANIVISQNPKVLTIPKNYLVGNDSVWVEENGDKKKIKILKGVENMELVEVKGGLNEKSKLVKGE